MNAPSQASCRECSGALCQFRGGPTAGDNTQIRVGGSLVTLMSALVFLPPVVALGFLLPALQGSSAATQFLLIAAVLLLCWMLARMLAPMLERQVELPGR